MNRNKIPTHNHIADNRSVNFLLLQISDKVLQNISDNTDSANANSEHTDDHFGFFFLQEGTATIQIDFKEIELNNSTVFCILPGQVHSTIRFSNIKGWALIVDALLVKNEYKEIFNKLHFLSISPLLSQEESDDLLHCISLVNKKYASNNELISQSVLHDLVSSYIGMIAEICQKGFPVIRSNRYMEITSQFKTSLSANYQTMKRPNQYASEINISPGYLNEAVKNTTGLSVQDFIQNEIILQAKRLLYYTDLTIKEISINLGYEDWAYFTRLFTKSTNITPSEFRKINLK
ncbi:MAG: helix-turn-helix domain-containing protein [Bacteroidales bacterium]|nr:helix-turn-helix domain-containing protein [Bacteroidales bacterium]